jgi:hypothetical protein
MYSRGIVARSARNISTWCNFPWRLCSVPLKVFFLSACDYLRLRGAISEVNYSCLSPDINEKLSHKMLEEMAVIPVKITHQALNNLR